MQKDTWVWPTVNPGILYKALQSSGNDISEKILPSTRDLMSTLNETLFCAEKAFHGEFLTQSPFVLLLLNGS